MKGIAYGEPDHTMAALAGITMLMSGMPRRRPDKGTILMKQRLADMTGKEVTVLTVTSDRLCQCEGGL
ncbi:MAG TPA: hypothetical protein VFX10_08690 [Nitrospira sp.]|nr:hypothetical protein [Nitrospira sp.]